MVKRIFALMLVPFALVAIGVVSMILYQAVNDNCSYQNVDALPSPTGNLSIVRTEKHCSNDEETPPMMFALLRSGVPLGKGSVFLTSADYEGIRSSLSIFPKWIDNQNLLIAAPVGSTLKKTHTEFDGVHIHFAYYPLDSDKTKDENLRRQIEKKVHFEPKFKIDHGIGVPGIGCNLTIRTHDGEHLDELTLSMTARTIFAVNAIDSRSVLVLRGAYSEYDFQIDARDTVERPDKHATNADVVGFAPNDGRSRLVTTSLNYPRTKAPSGEPMPKWDFGYSPNDPHDIVSIAERIKAGSIAIRVSFWLDNEVVVFSGEKPDDQKPIEMFERCIKENHIFDTPRHSPPLPIVGFRSALRTTPAFV